MNKRKTIVPGFDSLLEMLASRDGQMRQKARKSLMALGQPVGIPLVKVMKKFNLAQCRWVAAKVFEKDTYFEQAAMDIRALPKLEGTVHVNMALVLKFLPNYLLAPTPLPEVPRRRDSADDAFLFHQGPARGLGKVRFANWRTPYDAYADVPNVAVFREQAEGLVDLLTTAGPDAEQAKDLDLLLAVGELFTLVVYGQLILEQAGLTGLDHDLVDQIFDVLVRDFSAYAVDLHGKASSTKAQQLWALEHVRKPAAAADRYDRVWQQVRALAGAYEMRP